MSSIENKLLEETEEENRPTFEHGMLCSRLIRHLGNYLDGKGLGEVVDSTPEYRFLARKLKKPGRYPDVSFVRQERLPADVRSYPEIAPDLAIEVASPSDRDYDIEAKVSEYQKFGVSLVWVIHPFSRTVEVYCRENGLKSQKLIGDDELDGGIVLPGFKLKVSRIFDYPPPPIALDEAISD